MLIMINKKKINTQCGWPAWEDIPLELSFISGGGGACPIRSPQLKQTCKL